jgi:transcription antitermination factor NusG
MLSPYLFARSASMEELKSVSSLYGVQGLVSDGSGRPLEMSDDFVQGVIHESRGAADSWSKGIKRGSFVRILLGSSHMLCGSVRKIVAGVADVEVSLRLRTVRITIPVRALLNLDHVATGDREYFYGSDKV